MRSMLNCLLLLAPLVAGHGYVVAEGSRASRRPETQYCPHCQNAKSVCGSGSGGPLDQPPSVYPVPAGSKAKAGEEISLLIRGTSQHTGLHSMYITCADGLEGAAFENMPWGDPIPSRWAKFASHSAKITGPKTNGDGFTWYPMARVQGDHGTYDNGVVSLMDNDSDDYFAAMSGRSPTAVDVKFIIPAAFGQCDHAIMQHTWQTANSCFPGDCQNLAGAKRGKTAIQWGEAGKCKTVAHVEGFFGCIDIAIEAPDSTQPDGSGPCADDDAAVCTSIFKGNTQQLCKHNELDQIADFDCRKTCGTCTEPSAAETCEDNEPDFCAVVLANGLCMNPSYEVYVMKECRKTCGFCAQPVSGLRSRSAMGTTQRKSQMRKAKAKAEDAQVEKYSAKFQEEQEERKQYQRDCAKCATSTKLKRKRFNKCLARKLKQRGGVPDEEHKNICQDAYRLLKACHKKKTWAHDNAEDVKAATECVMGSSPEKHPVHPLLPHTAVEDFVKECLKGDFTRNKRRNKRNNKQ